MTSARRILGEKRRLILPIAIVLAANVAIFAAAVVPLTRRVDSAADRAALATETLGQARARHQAAEALVTGMGQADDELHRFYQEVLPADWTAARRITYLRLVQLAREHGLQPARTGSEPQTNKDSALARLQMTMQLTGDYASIRRFIYDLETAPDFVVIENVALAQGSEANAPLVLTIEVSTYYWAGGAGG